VLDWHSRSGWRWASARRSPVLPPPTRYPYKVRRPGLALRQTVGAAIYGEGWHVIDYLPPDGGYSVGGD
jgi:hypothetical protein